MFFLNYSTVVDPLLRGIRLYALKFSGMRAGNRVLDVCCGTGDQVYYYARAGMTATGIDLDPNMLKLAEKDKRRQTLNSVSFQLADARSLPFKANTFDYVFISFALHEKERDARDKVISEMKRVVRREGALMFIDFQVPLPKNLLSWLVKAAEFMAGSKHYKCFKDYLKQGGLDVILRKNQLTLEKRDYLNNRLITIIKTGNL